MNIYFFLGFFFIILAEASKKKDLSSFQLDFATNVEYTASDSWKEGFNGKLVFTTTRSLNGWSLVFKFFGKLAGFQCWTGDVENVSFGKGTSEFKVVNKDYNGEVEKGKTMEVGFMGEFPAGVVGVPKVPTVKITLQGSVIYQNNKKEQQRTTPPSNILQGRTTTDINYILERIRLNKLPTISTNLVTTTEVTVKPTTLSSTKPFSKQTTSSTTTLSTNAEDENSPSVFKNLNILCEIFKNMSQSRNDSKEVQKNLANICTFNEPTTQNSSLSLNSTDAQITTTTTVPTTSFTKFFEPRVGPNDYKQISSLHTPYNYVEVLHLSNLFYEAQKSGKLPDNYRIPWRSDSALNDIGDNNRDLTGGFYDAGDNIKFGFPMAYSMTVLSWGVLEFYDAYQLTEELPYIIDVIKWGTDYILKAHTSKYELYGQVGDPEKEHDRWDRPENITGTRPAYKISPTAPGSDLAAETSAALSAAYLVFYKYFNGSSLYGDRLLQHSKDLLEFAQKFPGFYHDSIPQAKPMYKSTNYEDEIVWALVWMYRATGNISILEKVTGMYYNDAFFKVTKHLQFSWDNKIHGIQMLLAQVSQQHKKEISKHVENYCSNLRLQKKIYTKRGLLYLEPWAPLRYAASSAFICLMAANEGIESSLNIKWVKNQISYMLGSTGKSFVVGFGENYPKQPHHRASSCPLSKERCSFAALDSKGPNPNILYGALVGGPDQNDEFFDNRKDYRQNEVALDYNAAFQGVIAGLIEDAFDRRSFWSEKQIAQKTKEKRTNEPWFKNFIEYQNNLLSDDQRGKASMLRFSLLELLICFLFQYLM